jgi:hypothetical protein
MAKRSIEPVRNPELVFGLVGPIGVELDFVVEAIQSSLEQVGYSHKFVHITDLMRTKKVSQSVDDSSYASRYKSLIRYANEYRKQAGDARALAARTIVEIRKIRRDLTENDTEPSLNTAYIVRQFKRPEEIELM